MQAFSSMPLRQRLRVLDDQSRRLHDAARARDWDTVVGVGNGYAALVATLEGLPLAQPQDEEERLASLAQLKKIIDRNQEIEHLVRSHLKEIRERIDTTRQSRWLLDSYGRQPPPQDRSGPQDT